MRDDPSRWRLAVAAAVVFVSGGLIAWLAVAAFVATPRGDDLRGAVAQYEQIRCVEAQLLDRVSEGEPVHVLTPSQLMARDPQMGEGDAAYWSQRLTELAYPHLAVVPDGQSARQLVAVTMDPTGACSGIGVIVERI